MLLDKANELDATVVLGSVACLTAVSYLYYTNFKSTSSNTASQGAGGRGGLKRALHGIPLLGHAFSFAPENIVQTLLTFPKLYGRFVEFFILGTRNILVSDTTTMIDCMMKRPKKFRRSSNFDRYAELTNLDSR